MSTRVHVLAVSALLLLVATAPAEAPAKETPPPDPVWRAEDVVNQERPGDMDLAPDGTRVVWVLRRPDEKKHRLVGDLRLTTLGPDPATVELTVTRDSDTSPRFSPDGRHIAFLSNRDLPDPGDPKPEKPQVWLMPAAGGEPRPVTRFRRGVEGFDWLDDGRLVVAAKPDPGLRERRFEDGKDDTTEVEDVEHWVPVRLFLVPVNGGKAGPLTGNHDVIDTFAVDRKGGRVLSRHLPSPHWEADHRGTPRLVLTTVEPRASRELEVSRAVLPEKLAFTPEGVALAVFTETTDLENLAAGRLRLAFWRDGMEGFEPVTPLANEEIAFVRPFSGGAILGVAEGVHRRLARATVSPRSVTIDTLAGEVEGITAAAVSGNGRTVVAVRSAPDTPPQLWNLDLDGNALAAGTQLTHLNPGLAARPKAKVEAIRWKGARGDTVEGILYHPTRRSGDGPAPLVVMIHGGPTWADHLIWDEDWATATNAYCQRGAYVLKPNYHGSVGYGLEFTESIGRGAYYDLEVPDILAGIDELVRRGLVDPERVGLVGWSNGSILAIALSLERHFAAVSAGAGDVNWTSDFGNCAFGPNFDRFYLGGEPWSNPEVYVAKSPLFAMEKVTSPTLIFFGTRDTSVPTEQGWEHYRALQQIGKAPVRFLLFPGEPHSPRKTTHQLRKLREELAWFDRYLFGRAPERKPHLKDAAPLGVLARSHGLHRTGDVLGEPGPGGVPLPQTAAVAALPGLEVGLTEVTRAQWAAFTGEPVPPGQGDLPAVVPDVARARAYCRWLSETTGRVWRLPTAAERKALLRAARKTLGTPNTLDAWGGEGLTPDDAALLRKDLEPLTLLRPAATSEAALLPAPGAGPWDPEVAVFDLSGNVAEWIADGDTVRPAGGSALRAKAEPRGRPVDGETVGLRVARVEVP